MKSYGTCGCNPTIYTCTCIYTSQKHQRYKIIPKLQENLLLSAVENACVRKLDNQVCIIGYFRERCHKFATFARYEHSQDS
jgi:hypothetical protein